MKGKDESEATLESLRISYTDLTQDEFISACGISRSTYHRWIAEKKPPRLTPEQIAKICGVCKMPVDMFLHQMGIDINALPRKESHNKTEQQSKLLNEEGSIVETDSLEIAHVRTMATAAKRLKVPLKALFGAFGIDTTGIPDDYPQPEHPPSEKGD